MAGKSFLLFALVFSLDAHALVSASQVQRAMCLPADSKAPVRAIYLHGLFKKSGGDESGFRQLEADNRNKIEKIAKRLGIRIAIPLAPNVSSKGMRMWNGATLSQIESGAEEACKAPLDNPRMLIGFSNGGYMARKVALGNCAAISKYSKILAIGAPEKTQSGRCAGTKLINTNPHIFPGTDYFDLHLFSLRQAASPSQTVKTDCGDCVVN